MSTTDTFAMIDTTDPNTPIWNEVLAEFRERLTAAGILYTPPARPKRKPRTKPATEGNPDASPRT